MNIPLIFTVIILVLLSAGLYRNWKVQASPNQKIFSEGKIPNPLLNGFLKGSVKGLKTDWQGKKFEASRNNREIERERNGEKSARCVRKLSGRLGPSTPWYIQR